MTLKTIKDPVYEFLASLPSATSNNSRAWFMNVFRKSKKERYGGYYTRLMEDLSGIPSDRGQEDTGMHWSDLPTIKTEE